MNCRYNGDVIKLSLKQSTVTTVMRSNTVRKKVPLQRCIEVQIHQVWIRIAGREQNFQNLVDDNGDVIKRSYK